MQNLEENKKNAMAFYNLAFNQCRPADAIATYVGDHYTQHNPHGIAIRSGPAIRIMPG